MVEERIHPCSMLVVDVDNSGKVRPLGIDVESGLVVSYKSSL